MTNTASRGATPWTTGTTRMAAQDLVASWGVLAGAARAALAMIPTSEEARVRQEPLLRELQRAAAATPDLPTVAGPPEGITSGARHLVESTLDGLREPASSRHYDAERAQGLRRRVLTFVVLAADEVARAEVRRGSIEQETATAAARAGLLARAALVSEPRTAPA